MWVERAAHGEGGRAGSQARGPTGSSVADARPSRAGHGGGPQQGDKAGNKVEPTCQGGMRKAEGQPPLPRRHTTARTKSRGNRTPPTASKRRPAAARRGWAAASRGARSARTWAGARRGPEGSSQSRRLSLCFCVCVCVPVCLFCPCLLLHVLQCVCVCLTASPWTPLAFSQTAATWGAIWGCACPPPQPWPSCSSAAEPCPPS